jgi:CRP/FNR family transcriptional regulator, cyclic AMP receptor protein
MRTLQEMLSGSLWSGALSPEQFDWVARNAFERRVAAGGFVFSTGTPADQWTGVIEGLAKMSISTPDGRAATFTGVTSGGWFGEGSLLKPGERWRYDSIALRDTRLACIPRRIFNELLATSLPFNRFVLMHLNARLSLFISLAEFDRLLGPDARVARCLASLFDPDLYPHTEPLIQLTQDEVALLSGVSRQRANKALHELESAGLLHIEFKGIRVLDLPGLRRYLGPKVANLPGARRPAQPAASPAPAGF